MTKQDKHPSESPRKRTRTVRPYPSCTFPDALALGRDIFRLAGNKIRRLTLCEKTDRSPTSSATRDLITNSNKYGITSGSFQADVIELTEDGRKIVDSQTPPRDALRAKLKLSIESVAPFKRLFDEYVGQRLPAHEVMRDFLVDADLKVSDFKECIDIFVVNLRDAGLLRMIAGAEMVIPIDQAAEELPAASVENPTTSPPVTSGIASMSRITDTTSRKTKVDWSKICFYISPIGSADSDERRHADLFQTAIIEPAMKDLGLDVVRADSIGDPGMIAQQVLEYIKRCKFAVADLSFGNPNVFYEVALRHSCRLPIVQIKRKADRLPFDVNQVRTIEIDTSSIYTLVPQLESYRSELATMARNAIDDPQHVSNPISVFYPEFWK